MIANWARVRDMFVFWPWYRREASARMAVAMPAADVIHEAVVDLLRAGERYPFGYRAAFGYDGAASLARLTVPTALVANDEDPASVQLRELDALPAGVSVEVIGADMDERVAELLAAGAEGLRPSRPPRRRRRCPVASRSTSRRRPPASS